LSKAKKLAAQFESQFLKKEIACLSDTGATLAASAPPHPALPQPAGQPASLSLQPRSRNSLFLLIIVLKHVLNLLIDL
jgi:hypothetical protein